MLGQVASNAIVNGIIRTASGTNTNIITICNTIATLEMHKILVIHTVNYLHSAAASMTSGTRAVFGGLSFSRRS